MKYKLGILGAGIMGQAIMSRIIDCDIIKAEDIAVFDIDSIKLNSINYNITKVDLVQSLVDNCEYILLAIKPQNFIDLCKNTVFKAENTILSIMAGVSIASIKHNISVKCDVIRIMPNTPCQIGLGVSAICFEDIPQQKQDMVTKMFTACGEVVVVAENKFDAVTCVSGSGPAYVYMFADAMIKGGLNGGLSYEESKILALNTIIGTANMALQSNEKLSNLVEKVCSKGGTTIEAVEIFKKENLEQIITKGMDACREKSIKLSELI